MTDYNKYTKARRYDRIARMWGEDPYDAACKISQGSHYTNDGIVVAATINMTFSDFLLGRLRSAEKEIKQLMDELEETRETLNQINSSAQDYYE